MFKLDHNQDPSKFTVVVTAASESTTGCVFAMQGKAAESVSPDIRRSGGVKKLNENEVNLWSIKARQIPHHFSLRCFTWFLFWFWSLFVVVVIVHRLNASLVTHSCGYNVETGLDGY